VQLSTWEDQAWRDFFERHGIEPYVLTYEDLAVSPKDAALALLQHLGIEAPDSRQWRWEHQQQADALTEQWVQGYEAHKDVRG
jgi:LPS sulfotransferase NodH